MQPAAHTPSPMVAPSPGVSGVQPAQEYKILLATPGRSVAWISVPRTANTAADLVSLLALPHHYLQHHGQPVSPSTALSTLCDHTVVVAVPRPETHSSPPHSFSSLSFRPVNRTSINPHPSCMLSSPPASTPRIASHIPAPTSNSLGDTHHLSSLNPITTDPISSSLQSQRISPSNPLASPNTVPQPVSLAVTHVTKRILFPPSADGILTPLPPAATNNHPSASALQALTPTSSTSLPRVASATPIQQASPHHLQSFSGYAPLGQPKTAATATPSSPTHPISVASGPSYRQTMKPSMHPMPSIPSGVQSVAPALPAHQQAALPPTQTPQPVYQTPATPNTSHTMQAQPMAVGVSAAPKVSMSTAPAPPISMTIPVVQAVSSTTIPQVHHATPATSLASPVAPALSYTVPTARNEIAVPAAPPNLSTPPAPAAAAMSATHVGTSLPAALGVPVSQVLPVMQSASPVYAAVSASPAVSTAPARLASHKTVGQSFAPPPPAATTVALMNAANAIPQNSPTAYTPFAASGVTAAPHVPSSDALTTSIARGGFSAPAGSAPAGPSTLADPHAPIALVTSVVNQPPTTIGTAPTGSAQTDSDDIPLSERLLDVSRSGRRMSAEARRRRNQRNRRRERRRRMGSVPAAGEVRVSLSRVVLVRLQTAIAAVLADPDPHVSIATAPGSVRLLDADGGSLFASGQQPQKDDESLDDNDDTEEEQDDDKNDEVFPQSFSTHSLLKRPAPPPTNDQESDHPSLEEDCAPPRKMRRLRLSPPARTPRRVSFAVDLPETPQPEVADHTVDAEMPVHKATEHSDDSLDLMTVVAADTAAQDALDGIAVVATGTATQPELDRPAPTVSGRKQSPAKRGRGRPRKRGPGRPRKKKTSDDDFYGGAMQSSVRASPGRKATATRLRRAKAQALQALQQQGLEDDSDENNSGIGDSGDHHQSQSSRRIPRNVVPQRENASRSSHNTAPSGTGSPQNTPVLNSSSGILLSPKKDECKGSPNRNLLERTRMNSGVQLTVPVDSSSHMAALSTPVASNSKTPEPNAMGTPEEEVDDDGNMILAILEGRVRPEGVDLQPETSMSDSAKGPTPEHEKQAEVVPSPEITAQAILFADQSPEETLREAEACRDSQVAVEKPAEAQISSELVIPNLKLSPPLPTTLHANDGVHATSDAVVALDAGEEKKNVITPSTNAAAQLEATSQCKDASIADTVGKIVETNQAKTFRAVNIPVPAEGTEAPVQNVVAQVEETARNLMGLPRRSSSSPEFVSNSQANREAGRLEDQSAPLTKLHGAVDVPKIAENPANPRGKTDGHESAASPKEGGNVELKDVSDGKKDSRKGKRKAIRARNSSMADILRLARSQGKLDSREEKISLEANDHGSAENRNVGSGNESGEGEIGKVDGNGHDGQKKPVANYPSDGEIVPTRDGPDDNDVRRGGKRLAEEYDSNSQPRKRKRLVQKKHFDLWEATEEKQHNTSFQVDVTDGPEGSSNDLENGQAEMVDIEDIFDNDEDEIVPVKDANMRGRKKGPLMKRRPSADKLDDEECEDKHFPAVEFREVKNVDSLVINPISEELEEKQEAGMNSDDAIGVEDGVGDGRARGSVDEEIGDVEKKEGIMRKGASGMMDGKKNGGTGAISGMSVQRKEETGKPLSHSNGPVQKTETSEQRSNSRRESLNVVSENGMEMWGHDKQINDSVSMEHSERGSVREAKRPGDGKMELKAGMSMRGDITLSMIDATNVLSRKLL